MRTETERQAQEDLHRLAGTLPHRGPNTKSERSAAEYIVSRFEAYTNNVSIEDFESPDSYYLLIAGYYSEFFIVTLVSIWWPWVGLGYGVMVFGLYLAEVTGYRVLSRLMPRYQSQNVAARLFADRPRRLYVVTAHHDSGIQSPLTNPVVRDHIRWWHLALVVCMAAILSGCVFRGMNVFTGDLAGLDVGIQGVALTALMAGAGFLAYCEMAAQYTRGALGNASGVAVLLALAQSLENDPLEEADVWLVSTGSKEGGLNGMRHLINSHDFDKAISRFINVDHVGETQLRYVTKEGLLATFRCDREMVDVAEETGASYGAGPFINDSLPTDLLIPLARGYRSIGITSTDEDGHQAHRLRDTDTLAKVEARDVTKAARYVEAIMRTMETRAKQSESAHAPSAFHD